MTEQEWLTSKDSAAVLKWLTSGGSGPGEEPNRIPPSDRKLRLAAVSCVRRLDQYFDSSTDGSRQTCLLAESLADGEMVSAPGYNHERWYVLRRDAAQALGGIISHPQNRVFVSVFADILREIIGNPYLGWKLLLKTLTPTVVQLAQWAYDERLPDGTLDPFRLTQLADALEEEGCSAGVALKCPGTKSEGQHRHSGRVGQVIHDVLHETDPGKFHHHHDEKCKQTLGTAGILEHLRSPGPHVRGCWVVDLILGKN